MTTTKPGAARDRKREAIRAQRRQMESGMRGEDIRRGAIIIALVAVGAIAVAGLLFGVSQLFRPPEKVGALQEDRGAQHVAPRSFIEYAQYPPASGNHYPSAAEPGNYDVTIPEGYWIHSLEHGYTVLLYNCATPEECTTKREQIQPFFTSLPKSKFGYVKLVAVPYDRPLESPWVLLAWNYKLGLETLDPAQVERFYKSHLDRGPEPNAG